LSPILNRAASLPVATNFAGDLEAEDIAGSRGWRIISVALHDVAPVYSRCRDFDQDLVPVRRRHGALFENKDFRAARPADADDGHLRG